MNAAVPGEQPFGQGGLQAAQVDTVGVVAQCSERQALGQRLPTSVHRAEHCQPVQRMALGQKIQDQVHRRLHQGPQPAGGGSVGAGAQQQVEERVRAQPFKRAPTQFRAQRQATAGAPGFQPMGQLQQNLPVVALIRCRRE